MTKTASHRASQADTAAMVAPTALTSDKIIQGSMLLAAGAGALPLPGWDAAAIVGVQVKMLSDLSASYGVPFTENLGKTAVLALLGGMAPGLIAQGSLGLVLKLLPGIGSVFGAIAQPAFAAAATYGVGRVYVSHLESGGTLLNFDAKNFKETFTSEVKAGMKKVSEIKL